MPRLQFSTSIPATLSLSETQEVVDVLTNVSDALREYGHTITDEVSIGSNPITPHFTARFAVQIGKDS